MVDFYYLDVDSQHVGLLCGVNDAPIVRDASAQGIRTTYPINEWIHPRTNRLTAFLFWPEDQPFVPGNARVKASVFVGDPQVQWVRPKTVLGEFEWPRPDVQEGYPYQFELPLQIPAMPPATLWDRAEPIATVSTKDREAIVKLVEDFRAALLGNDPDIAFRFVEERFADEARAYGKDPAGVRKSLVGVYASGMRKTGRTSQPLPVSDAVFDLVANSQLVHVTRRGVEYPIQMDTDSGDRYTIPMYFARVNGKWEIAR